MAFATSNIKLESAGSLWNLTGNWTGGVGDASGTITVGGRVTSLQFYNRDATSQEDRPTPASLSQDTSTGITTITVHNHADVTDGSFSVLYR